MGLLLRETSTISLLLSSHEDLLHLLLFFHFNVLTQHLIRKLSTPFLLLIVKHLNLKNHIYEEISNEITFPAFSCFQNFFLLLKDLKVFPVCSKMIQPMHCLKGIACG